MIFFNHTLNIQCKPVTKMLKIDTLVALGVAIKNMPETCPRYAKTMPKICPIYALYMPKICQRYAKDMPKIFPRYAQDKPKMCSRYAQHLPNICPRCAQDMPRICPTSSEPQYVYRKCHFKSRGHFCNCAWRCFPFPSLEGSTSFRLFHKYWLNKHLLNENCYCDDDDDNIII